MTDLKEKTIESTKIYEGKILNLKLTRVELPNEKKTTKEIVKHKGGVAVIPYEDEEVILIQQFRKAVEEVLFELPAGMLERRENPLECARRELKEETGYKAGSFKKVYEFYTSPGFTDEVIHLYLATDLSKHKPEMDQDEFIKLKKLRLKKIEEKLKTGQIKDAKTIIGLQYLLQEAGETDDE